MKKRMLAALLLALCLILTGCKLDFAGYFQRVQALLSPDDSPTAFDQMIYTRPDMEQLQHTIDDCCNRISAASDLDTVIQIIYEAYVPLDGFSTASALANIHYCKDLTNAYWAEEYAFCLENSADAQAALDQLYRALAKSEFRQALESEEYFGPDFFGQYEGETVYDQIFTQLLTQEAMLEGQYYALWNAVGEQDLYSEEFFASYGLQMEQLYVELIAVRQQMAEYLGFESYPEFAYSFYYGRDYTCDQATAYLADIRAELAPLYAQSAACYEDIRILYCTEEDALQYLSDMAYAMGGDIRWAYDLMISNGLYDISYSDTKYEASFEIYIRGYRSPYLFINPTLSDYDKLTLAHEFGHFCCDYVSGGTSAGVDVAEVFSQGMEYLSLCYTSNTGDLETLKMLSGLSVMVEQAMYASFEQQVYNLKGADLTVENIRSLFAQVSQAYGMDSWGVDARSYVYVTHFYTNPMYVIGYVVSNDVALQLYQLEQAQSGAGLEALQNAFTSAHTGIVAFTQAYGLESPFSLGRITSIKETFLAVLG